MANSKKRPKQKQHPKRLKVPRGAEAAKCIPNSKFCWRVADVDMGGKWGWSNPKPDVLFKTIIPKLHEFETMKWSELEGKESHFIAYDRICNDAQSRLKCLGKQDVEEVFSLRVSSRQRIYGVRIGAILNLLWWDPEHEICPSKKKHT